MAQRRPILLFSALMLGLATAAHAQVLTNQDMEEQAADELAAAEARAALKHPDPGVMTSTAPVLMPERKETFSLEILGRAGAYSLNFDKMLGRDVALGLGLSIYNIDGLNHSASMLIVPVYANLYFNDDHHRFFVSLGLNAISASEAVEEFGFTGGGLGATAGLGYEFRGSRGGLFRLAPYVLYSRGNFAVTGGLTIGNAFF